MDFISEDKELILDYSQLSDRVFKEKINKNGCILLTNVFSQQEIDQIRNEVLDFFYIIKNLQYNKLLGEQSLLYLSGGHPANILPSLNLLENALNKEKFISAISCYLNTDQLVVKAESTSVRRCDPNKWKNFLPWHQDVFQRKDSFFTCWMPLVEIDDLTPTVDLIPKKAMTSIAEQDGIDVAYNGKGINDDIIINKLYDKRWRPKMQIGDVLIFDPYCPHRTSYDGDFTKERYSIDVRICPSDCIPEETWTTSVFTLPSRKGIYKERPTRSLFDFKHLVTMGNEEHQKTQDSSNVVEMKNTDAETEGYYEKIRGVIKKSIGYLSK